jgi:hypothetical protein
LRVLGVRTSVEVDETRRIPALVEDYEQVWLVNEPTRNGKEVAPRNPLGQTPRSRRISGKGSRALFEKLRRLGSDLPLESGRPL